MTTKNTVTPIVASLAVAFGGVAAMNSAFAQTQTTDAQKQERIEVTGSRIKRADAEGAVPVTVIDRAAIEASGDSSVAELLRDVTFSSFGNFRPQSGSSAQGLADVDLRGLGSARTLVLIDGRRAPNAPYSIGSQDLNTIPLAAVERIELLTDGASAIYGSDAIGGVVNIITRKNFNGGQVTYGEQDPKVVGGDVKEMSALFGTSGSKGRLMGGVSSTSRDIVFTRDQIGYTQGVSSFGNNYRLANASNTAPTGGFIRYPGFACNQGAFYVTGAGTCSFDFNSVAANEASTKNQSLFLNGELNISDDWQAYMSAFNTSTSSFGRYAPVPGEVFIPSDSAQDPVKGDGRGVFLRHRFAAGGNRDNNNAGSVRDITLGVKGRLFDRVDVDFYGRSATNRVLNVGRGYVVTTLAEAAIVDGSYSVADPFNAPAAVLQGFTTNTGRDSIEKNQYFYGNASMELFKLGSGTVNGTVGFETRKIKYSDQYDSLSEAGVVAGSSGNSSGGNRKVESVFFELVAPVTRAIELSLAGRHDSYSDYGSDFSPKFSARFQPLKNLTLRGSFGEGFRAPPLDIVTQKPSFSADSVTDFPTCRVFGGTARQCGDTNGDGIVDAAQAEVQIDSTVIANPNLKSEKSRQVAFGVVYDPLDWLSLRLDTYDIQVKNRISNITAQTVINRTLNPALGAVPAGLGVVRDPATGGILSLTRGPVNEGTLDVAGYDINIRTDFKLGGFGRLENNLIYSVSQKYKQDGGRNLIGDQGAPKERMTLSNTWKWNKFTTNLTLNHIGKQPGDSVSTNAGIATKAYNTTNVSVNWVAPTKTSITVGVNNAGNKFPELNGFDGRPWNFYLYDAYGRQVYFRVSQTF